MEKTIVYLNLNAYPKWDPNTCGKCAMAIRKSLEAGGINTTGRPNSAKDYGPSLIKWGFEIISSINYNPQNGDIRVFPNYPGGSIHGHIDMFNGKQWVSDFKENGYWPGRGWRENQTPFVIFRWGLH